ncbi:MAG: leucyl aminopeptidase family protein, partial [Proteobacteria bacterium]|nr:leucyl aminopeptidase family protein [Pseudomonadota bacterium]
MTDFAALLQPDCGQPARTIEVVHPDAYADWLKTQPKRMRALLDAQKVTGKAGDKAILPGDGDDWSALLVCDEDVSSPWRIASQPGFLPEGAYRLKSGDVGAAGLGWLLAQYRFERYAKADKNGGARVLLANDPAGIDETVRLAEATALVRDLVNTGASDMGPAELEAEAEKLAKTHDARVTVTRGDALAKGYPMIDAVGRAAAKHRAPRLIELEWGNPKHPRIALIGKG